MKRWMALSPWQESIEMGWSLWSLNLSSFRPVEGVRCHRHVFCQTLRKFLISEINNSKSSPRQLIFSWFSGKFTFSLFSFSVEKHEIKKLQNRLEWRRKVFLFCSPRTVHGSSWIKTLIWIEARKAGQPPQPTTTSFSHPWAISFSERRIVSHIDLTIIQLFLGRKWIPFAKWIPMRKSSRAWMELRVPPTERGWLFH